MADPDGMDRVDVNMDALKSEIRRALINQKANACPIAMRMAWHSSGTYDKNTKTGGSNGGTMVFPRTSIPYACTARVRRSCVHRGQVLPQLKCLRFDLRMRFELRIRLTRCT